MRTVLFLLATVILAAFSVNAQSSQMAVRNPRNMSYGGIWNQIEEYEGGSMPDELGSRFDGYELSVGVVVDEHGRIAGCGFQSMLRRPSQKALHLSGNLLRRLSEPVCSSIQTWKFRPFRVRGRPTGFSGPIVVKIERQRFVLIPSNWQYNPPPVERK